MAKKETSSWLRELQQKSWEPEILLSGIVLYGMFQIPDLLDQFLRYFESNILGNFSDIKTLIGILKVGVYWLITGLIIHLFSRGVWIGFVGLSYTFPKGVRTKKLQYKGRFQKRIESVPSLEVIVNKLEMISSSIFSTSFMLFMAMLGGYCYIFFLLALPYMTLTLIGFEYESATMTFYRSIYTIPIVSIALLSFLDFVTLGVLKKIKWLAPIYWPIYYVVSKITLSRFYRNTYYVFAGNTNKWVFGSLLVLFSMISVLLFRIVGENDDSLFSKIELWNDSQVHGIPKKYYDNLNSESPSRTASIQSDIISTNTIKLFIAADVLYQRFIEKQINYDSIQHSSVSKEYASDIGVINDFYHVYLDDSLVNDAKFYYYTKVQTDQKGYLAYIDIAHLTKGMHTISVGPPPKKEPIYWDRIKFYRE